MKFLPACFVSLALFTSPVVAGPITPDCSDIPDIVVVTPDGSWPYIVSVYSCELGPLSGVQVEVEFGEEADALIAWGDGQDHPTVTGISDANGNATFYIRGGGCVDQARFNPSTFVVQVRLDGIVWAEPFAVMSPDVVNGAGLLPTDLGTTICQNGMSTVGLADAIFHTAPIKQALTEPCSKMTRPETDPISLEDAVALTPYIKTGVTMTCQ